MPIADFLGEFARRLEEQARIDREKDLLGANQSIPLIEAQLAAVPGEIQKLRQAKETLEPSSVRVAAAEAERLYVRILVARDALERGAARNPENAADMRAVVERTKQPLRDLASEVARARMQATRLEGLAGGTLEDLPQGKLPSSPDETRAMAIELAPPGLCDDPSMQDPTSHPCPLDPAQRSATREFTKRELARIALNWRDAAGDEQLRVRLAPLLRTAGFNPLTDLLFPVVLGWLGSMAGDVFLGAVNKARNGYVNGQLPRAARTIALEPVKAGDLNRPTTVLITGLGSKLVDAAKTHLVHKPTPADTTHVMFDQIRNAAEAWEAVAESEVTQLPDPALVALGRGLAGAHFDIAFFRSKIAKLVERFEHVDTVGQTTLEHIEPLRPVWVVSKTGSLRLALARRQTSMVDVGGAQTGREVVETEIERPTGRWVFDSWVDRSLYGVAFAHDAKPITLTEFDSRWHAAPGALPDQEDVQMFEPQRSATSK